MPDLLEQQIETLLRQVQDQTDAEILSTLRAHDAGTIASPHRHGWAADVPLTREHFAALREELDRWPPVRATPPMLSQGDWHDILGLANNPETPNRNGDILPGGFGGSLLITGGTGVGTTGIGGAVTLIIGGSPRLLIPEFGIMPSPLFETHEVHIQRRVEEERSIRSKADAILDAVVRTLAPGSPTIRGWRGSIAPRIAKPI